MLTQIETMMRNGNFEEALEFITEKLKQIPNPIEYFSEEEYSKLLNFRITINSVLGKRDEIVSDYIRNQKYPSEFTHKINNFPFIYLTMRNNILVKTDAFVNTVSAKIPFEDFSGRSATKDIVDHVGIDKIKEQLSKLKSYKKGDFIILEHPNLMAGKSFNIFYYDDQPYDLEILKNSIYKVLDTAVKMKIKTLGFVALGYEYVVKETEQNRKNEIAKEIADCIAEAIVSFYQSKTKTNVLPIIRFNFVNFLTMRTFDNAFFYYSSLPKEYYEQQNRLTKLEKEMLDKVNTKSEEFIENIKGIAYSVLTDSSLLILGETGVGKTHFAEVVHDLSNRKNKSFISVNCSYLRQENLVIELFGWVKGSFTDAKEDGTGAIEAAEGGTLFLDEIGYADMDVQKSLLKFLDDGKYNKFGAKKNELIADVRLIFGTSGDLKNLIKKGLVLPEFYERINQVEFTIPPLRKRKEDINSLCTSILNKLNRLSDTKISFSREAYEELKKYKWPGNIRQLKIFVENLFNKTKYKNLQTIESEMIISNPPRDILYNETDRISLLEENLLELLKGWDETKGEFIDEVLNPIVAKVYLIDLQKPRTQSNKFLGMDGNNPKTSRIIRFHKKYDEVREKINRE